MQQLPLARTRFGADIVAEFLPPERESTKVVIFSSGCPGYPLGKDELMRKFSRMGYWTILYAYRGTWESGGTFLEYPPSEDVTTIINNLGKFEDLWSGAEYSIQNPEMYLIGGSFGGAATILASRDPRVKKAVALSAVTDWRAQAETLEPLETMNEYLPKAFGNGYRGEQEVYRKLLVGDFYNPTFEKETLKGEKLLLIHYKHDLVVHSAPAEALARDIGAKFVMLPGDMHMGVRSALLPNVFRHIEKFFKGK